MIIWGFLVAVSVALWCVRRMLSRSQRANAVVFLGSGGHTGEMLRMLPRLDLRGLTLNLIYSQGDEFSLERANATLATSNASRTKPNATASYAVPRARHVGQPLYCAIGGALASLAVCFRIMYNLRPKVLLCNGPGTCVMLVVATWTLALTGIPAAKIIYVESFARVETLSLTGKLLLPVADVFVVQWKRLHEKYPTTTYHGLTV